MLEHRNRSLPALPALAVAALPAVASLIVVHRAIFARLGATGLVGSECHCANRRRKNGKENF
jgi:hypothetical protein